MCVQSKQMCSSAKHSTSHYWHSERMETQNGAVNPFSSIANGTRAGPLPIFSYSITIWPLDKNKPKATAFVVCVQVCFSSKQNGRNIKPTHV